MEGNHHFRSAPVHSQPASQPTTSQPASLIGSIRFLQRAEEEQGKGGQDRSANDVLEVFYQSRMDQGDGRRFFFFSSLWSGFVTGKWA